MRRLWLLLLPLAAAGGCGQSNDGRPAVHPVTGQVLCDGRPLAGVEVTLMPTDAPMVPTIPRNPRAITGADGRFSIGTFADGDGAAEGGYQIICHWPKTAPGTEGEEEIDPSEDDRLLGWYDATHSKLSVRVKGGANDVPLKLVRHAQPPPKSDGVPGRN